MFDKKEKINFNYDNERKSKEIFLNSEERFIKEFKDININVTIIEILSKDNIDKSYFLLPYTDYLDNAQKFLNEDIITIQYTKGKLNFSNGKIIDINKHEFIFKTNIDPNLSGTYKRFHESYRYV